MTSGESFYGGIPVFRGIGVRRVQDLPLKRWNRMGGNGSFIQLYGTEGKWGLYVVEVPGAGALNPERHMYEEIMVVVEGRGTTEIWTDDQKKPHSFEWQRGSMFSVPLNCWHRIINAGGTVSRRRSGDSLSQRIRLEREGIRFDARDRVSFVTYGWRPRGKGLTRAAAR